MLLFCRHDQYTESSARRLLPLKADWMPELLGLVSFRPDDRHEGPFPMADGRIVGAGNHSELLETNRYYSKTYRLQELEEELHAY